ncbi:MAG TPA: DUF748 domain-containing protein [Burkholderiaceae bacterium]|nr:DUF748 domain-containing protein [Burkholderiaceae bacterium]
MEIRWKRWVAGSAGVMAVYAGAGFLLLPQIIKSQVPKIGQSVLERQMSVGEVRFNPYTLRLEVQDFRLAEANGAPLFSAGQLTVDLEWRSLFRRAWTLAEVRLTAPQALLGIGPDGTFNIAQLMDTLNRRPHEESSGMPRLSIASLVLEQGKLTLRDQRAGYADEYTPIDFKLANLSTLPDENGSYTFSADATGGGTLRWRGDASLNPIAGKGELVLDKVALPGVAAYLKPYTRASVTAGLLSAKLPYHFSYKDGKFDAGLDGAALGLHDLAVAQGAPAATFAALKTFELTGVQANLATRTATVEHLNAADGKFSLRRNANGELDLAQLGAPTAPKSTAAAAAPAAPAAAAAPAAPASATPTPAKAASAPPAPATANTAPAPAKPSAPPPPWKLQLKQLDFDRLAFDAIDETANPALKVSMDKAQLHLRLQAEQAPAGVKLNLDGAAFSLADLTIASGAQTPFKLGELGFTDGSIDLAGHRATFGRLYADGGQLQLAFDAKGQLAMLGHLPGSGKPAPTASSKATGAAKSAPAPAAAPEPAATPWQVNAKSVELNKFTAAYADQGTGIKANVQDFNLKLDDVSNDLKQAVKFQAGLAVREGGKLTAQGSVVPATGAVDTAVEVKQLALAPVQPLLAKFVKLKLASGTVSARGQLNTKPGPANRTSVRYVGAFDVSGLALNEDDGDRFASWKAVRTDKLTLSLAPDLLDIPELRIVEPNAKLIIENDRSFNAARLLVEPAKGASAGTPAMANASTKTAANASANASAKTSANASANLAAKPATSATPAKPAVAAANKSAAPASQPFPVHVQRVRLQNAKLDFTDLSLRPQFSAKVYELGGVITGLSSKRDARSQVELDGRVDEFGMARVRGQLNPFAASENTDLNVVFKNVDMVSASPYTMKFAGYKIAQGKISLDLEYKVRQNQLEGNNHIVLDQLTLGERIDSPDALKLPLELALAILKDSDGRIDLGLPVAGDMNDPQFSYGAVVWKAVGNVLTKIVTAPFRALGNLFGISGEKLEAISFDPGSDTLLPPERAKLAQVAQILAKRGQLTLSVPGQYSEQADGAALRARAVRQEIAKRAGIKLEAGEEPGPLDLGSSPVRSALRSLYGERFGSAELDKEKKAAEAAAAAPVAANAANAAKAADASSAVQPAAGQKKLAVWQKLGKLIQGEPQVADASAFYRTLQTKLEQRQPLPADALTRLGTQRAGAIVAALTEGGVNPASTRATAPEAVAADVGQPVNLKLALSAK